MKLFYVDHLRNFFRASVLGSLCPATLLKMKIKNSCEFCENSKIPFLTEHLRWLLL